MKSPRILPILALLTTAGAARADLLVAPTGGTVLSTSDDATVSQTISGFSFYGTPLASLSASTNGNLNLVGSSSTQLTVETAQISPLADDLDPRSTGSFTGLATGDYYAYTWNGIPTYNVPSSVWTFQAVLLRADATVAGVDFLQNDIVFAYGSLGSAYRNDDALIGVSNGSFATANLAPGSDPATGLIGRTASGPFFPTGENYVRYRFNGTTYDRAVVNASTVPEPATLAGLALGGLALLRRRRK